MRRIRATQRKLTTATPELGSLMQTSRRWRDWTPPEKFQECSETTDKTDKTLA